MGFYLELFRVTSDIYFNHPETMTHKYFSFY